jgi:hypothetical protein
MVIEIPEPFQELVEAAVRKVYEKYLRTPNLKPLYDWFENDGWDEIVMSGLGSCIYLESIASTDFYDDYLKEDF